MSEEETLLSFDEPLTRIEIAARLRSLADGFDSGGPLTIAAGDQTTTLSPPERPVFELEVEREWDDDESDGDDGDRPSETSIEVEIEIEWDEAAIDTDDAADSAADVSVGGGVDASGDTDTHAPGDERSSPAGENGDSDGTVEDDTGITPIDPDQDGIPTAATGDVETAESRGQFQLYVDRADKWRWRLVHRNGNVIAASGQGYASRQKAEQGMHSVMRNAPGAEAITVE